MERVDPAETRRARDARTQDRHRRNHHVGSRYARRCRAGLPDKSNNLLWCDPRGCSNFRTGSAIRGCQSGGDFALDPTSSCSLRPTGLQGVGLGLDQQDGEPHQRRRRFGTGSRCWHGRKNGSWSGQAGEQSHPSFEAVAGAKLLDDSFVKFDSRVSTQCRTEQNALVIVRLWRSAGDRGNARQTMPIFDEKEAAVYVGFSVRTLQRKRAEGDGPVYMRLSERRLGYDKADLDVYLASRKFASRAAELSKVAA